LDSCEIFEPQWFRIGQLRLPGDVTNACVQRQIVINSYAFSLFVAPSTAALPSRQLNQLVKALRKAVPSAKRIERTADQLTLSASDTHAIASWYPLFHHYPSRFGDRENPYIAKLPKRGLGGIVLAVTPEMIAERQISLVVGALKYMVATRENATAFKQRVVLMVQGFDDDPRGLWQIPEARDFVCAVFEECPFIMFLAHPKGGTLRLMLACWLGDESTLSQTEKADRITEFNGLAFRGLNEVTYRLAISQETNVEITQAAMRALYGELMD